MVREINLDNLGSTSKIEATNGHDNHLTNEPEIKDEYPSKKRKGNDARFDSTPKRRRSSLTRSPSKLSSSAGVIKPIAKVNSKSLFSKQEKEPKKSDLVASPVKGKRSSKSPKQSNGLEGHKVEENDISDQKVKHYCVQHAYPMYIYSMWMPVIILVSVHVQKPKMVEDDKGEIVSNDKSSAASSKKRKSRSVAGLAKVTFLMIPLWL